MPAISESWSTTQVRGRRTCGSNATMPLVVLGGPPCQGFSSHVKMKGDRHGRNTLVSVFGQLAVIASGVCRDGERARSCVRPMVAGLLRVARDSS